jgi:hypothetical protein
MTPLIVKYAGTAIDDEGRRMSKYWIKTKTARQHHAAFQKVSILLVAIGLRSLGSSAYWRILVTPICMQPRMLPFPIP